MRALTRTAIALVVATLLAACGGAQTFGLTSDDNNRDALTQRLADLYDEEPPEPGDVDQALYGGFLGEDDERLCRDVHRADPKDWRDLEKSFTDPRLQELLFRLRARNHPELLWATEHVRWKQVREERRPHAEAALARIAELRAEGAGDAALLEACEQAIRKRFPVG